MQSHPLTGIRVIEVANYMAGPFCAMQLADLGADVVKVENPDGGDTARDSAPFLDGESSPFIRLNRNKRSVAMNLKAPEAKQLFRQLVEGADIVVENLRPGTMGDLELDYPRRSTHAWSMSPPRAGARPVLILNSQGWTSWPRR